ncbi:MAG TPA: hypothetical protein PKA82_04790 [Pyrinomonadaceae bacterium]|nr:hypothetical protein [Pyrinomonadaceae bacterium]
MKFLTLFTLIFATLAISASAQKAMSVRDYYLAIPSQYINADAKKRASWIESEYAAEGNLSFNIPVKELTGEDGDGKAFGYVQVFKKKIGVVIGVATNMCEGGTCQGQLLFLDYNAGRWEDVTSDHAPILDNDEVRQILKKAPAFENKDSLADGSEVPIHYNFGGNDKVMQAIAGGTNGDGGVVVKTFKWNGVAFVDFEYTESPE